VSAVSRLALKSKLRSITSPPIAPSFTMMSALGELKKTLPRTTDLFCFASTSGPKYPFRYTCSTQRLCTVSPSLETIDQSEQSLFKNYCSGGLLVRTPPS